MLRNLLLLSGCLAAWLLSFCLPAGAQTASPPADRPAQFRTIYADAQHSISLDGIILSFRQRLLRLQVVNHAETARCPDGGFPFSYSVDELIGHPLDRSPPTVLLGLGQLSLARSAMRMHLASCPEFKKDGKGATEGLSYERTRLRLVSVYDHYAGIQEVTESRGFGQKSPVVLFDCGPYRITPHTLIRLDKRLIREPVISKARQEYQKLPPSERGTAREFHLHDYVLVPAGGGAAAEFLLPAGNGPNWHFLPLTVPVSHPLPGRYDQLRDAFVAAHPHLIPWTKALFYTISPDQTAVVYAVDRGLFWKGLTSEPRLIGHVNEVRGWQWHHSRFLKPAEHHAVKHRDHGEAERHERHLTETPLK